MAHEVGYFNVGDGIGIHVRGDSAFCAGFDQLPLKTLSLGKGQLTAGHGFIINSLIESKVRGDILVIVMSNGQMHIDAIHMGFLPFCPLLGHL